jgi:hypothetical protein
VTDNETEFARVRDLARESWLRLLLVISSGIPV